MKADIGHWLVLKCCWCSLLVLLLLLLLLLWLLLLLLLVQLQLLLRLQRHGACGDGVRVRLEQVE